MKKILLLSIAAAFAVTACDFLDRSPKDTISPENYFKTETDLQLFSNSFYNSLFDKELYGRQNDLIFSSSNLSDELRGGTNRTVPASGGGWTWTVLRKINTMLGNIDQCEEESVKEEYTALARFFRAYFYFEKVKRFGDVPWYETELGSDDEALYIPRDTREYVMRKMLEDIDYAIEYLPSEVRTYRVCKWAALALKSRFCLFEGTYRKYHGLSFPDDPDAHDYTYYLEQAAAASEEIMNSGKYKLFTTGDTSKDYFTLFSEVDASKDEYILAIDFDSAMEICHDRTFNSTQNGGLTVNKKFVDMYLMKDGTAFTSKQNWQTMQFNDEVADRDPRLAQSLVTPGYVRLGNKGFTVVQFEKATSGYQSIKFLMEFYDGTQNDLVAPTGKSYNDLPVFRYAEVLLNYAEALAELGTLQQSDIDKSIKLLRDRVGMPNLDMSAANASPDWYLSSEEYGYRNVTGSNKGVILEIRRERAVELFQEGYLRWYDLMRWKEGKCVEQEMYGQYFPGVGEYDLNGDGTAEYCLYADSKPSSSCTYIWQIGNQISLSDGTSGYVLPHKMTHEFNEERDYLYPIPTDDRSLNRNLTQNPGWDDGLDF